ncbi:uncharacterized protein LOC132743264 isoform X1 [Ruditapes philippinarum]|uniref:uncharacterized protein LOC132743264 isoform X1 n=1 Tax=Ruditapes philippinarum TaxID=129788 RepID=UPI00295A6B6A|nr:uncharacterized protein LOC132743264 isoform X1 [Ruditapes philippinarum]
MATVSNNCYADLHIYSESVGPEHIYNSLKRDKIPHTPVTLSWWAFHRRPFFQNSKFAFIVGLVVILVLAACSVSIGYFIGKNACEKRDRNNFHQHDESRFTETTQISTFTDIVSIQNTNKITSQKKATTTETIRTFKTKTSDKTTTKPRPPIRVNLKGKVFKIYAKENDQFWHFDGGHQVLKVVSSLWQPNDEFVKFTFEKQTDGSYKIKSRSVSFPRYMYDGYGVPGARGVYLNGDDRTDDDHMRYYITMETQGFYRIKTKATNRYVRLDKDKYVSSRYNLRDDRSLFKLVVV